MNTANCVTLWHDGESRVLPLISARITSAVDKNGIKQKGFFAENICTMRILAENPLDIAAGDYVRLGKYTGNADRSADFKVMKIYNNLRGTTPHYKLVCEK